jgi:hypothetical protein
LPEGHEIAWKSSGRCGAVAAGESGNLRCALTTIDGGYAPTSPASPVSMHAFMRVSLFSGSVLVENSMQMYGPSAVGAAVGTGSPGTLLGHRRDRGPADRVFYQVTT